ncbi:hypothetical protein ACFFQW_42730 [Umezawaea endophytica]|uniref:Uncharacterized protein n=1 Tax=Umezawaea endophytica TaxID=1654476 RepID=A0A9X2VTH5_9PSEU|nr:hypothetical protein [Umezawaea endophytica]MCS7482560.1 hypothetical protein [Umezawaea endophytica]
MTGKEGHPIIEHTHDALFSETAPDLFPKEQAASTHKSTTSGRALGNTQYEGLFQQPPIVPESDSSSNFVVDENEKQPDSSEAPRQRSSSRRRYN